MPPRIDIKPGERYGRLVVIEEAKPRKACHGYNRYFLCRCDCGNEKQVSLKNLRYGKARSCGCYSREISAKNGLKHIRYPQDRTSSRIHNIWSCIKSRCFCNGNPSYQRYGERGITMCDEWRKDFMAFLRWSLENGYRDDLTIDRINNDGNYEPSNCRWTTVREQANNRRNNAEVSFKGETHTFAEWERKTGIKMQTIRARLKKGWNVEKALTEPVRLWWRRPKNINTYGQD